MTNAEVKNLGIKVGDTIVRGNSEFVVVNITYGVKDSKQEKMNIYADKDGKHYLFREVKKEGDKFVGIE